MMNIKMMINPFQRAFHLLLLIIIFCFYSSAAIYIDVHLMGGESINPKPQIMKGAKGGRFLVNWEKKRGGNWEHFKEGNFYTNSDDIGRLLLPTNYVAAMLPDGADPVDSPKKFIRNTTFRVKVMTAYYSRMDYKEFELDNGVEPIFIFLKNGPNGAEIEKIEQKKIGLEINEKKSEKLAISESSRKIKKERGEKMEKLKSEAQRKRKGAGQGNAVHGFENPQNASHFDAHQAAMQMHRQMGNENWQHGGVKAVDPNTAHYLGHRAAHLRGNDIYQPMVPNAHPQELQQQQQATRQQNIANLSNYPQYLMEHSIPSYQISTYPLPPIVMPSLNEQRRGRMQGEEEEETRRMMMMDGAAMDTKHDLQHRLAKAQGKKLLSQPEYSDREVPWKAAMRINVHPFPTLESMEQFENIRGNKRATNAMDNVAQKAEDNTAGLSGGHVLEKAQGKQPISHHRQGEEEENWTKYLTDDYNPRTINDIFPTGIAKEEKSNNLPNLQTNERQQGGNLPENRGRSEDGGGSLPQNEGYFHSLLTGNLEDDDQLLGEFM